MATPRVNMKGYFKQQKKGNSVISKSKGGVNKKTPPSHSASLRSDVVQPPALLSHHGSPDLQQDYDENEVVLRQFDLNMAYGPCTGIPRLDRWNRAKQWGLNPPKEVQVLLVPGKVQNESLWDGRV
ncbi:uncharacterized protein LOC141619352 [Silene latifolia]|uniref:uncharacterized protein LOC141619352 n=1 Tax=Silene latifolia TaxID=37657 RepID=UPI003D76BFF1